MPKARASVNAAGERLPEGVTEVAAPRPLEISGVASALVIAHDEKDPDRHRALSVFPYG